MPARRERRGGIEALLRRTHQAAGAGPAPQTRSSELRRRAARATCPPSAATPFAQALPAGGETRRPAPRRPARQAAAPTPTEPRRPGARRDGVRARGTPTAARRPRPVGAPRRAPCRWPPPPRRRHAGAGARRAAPSGLSGCSPRRLDGSPRGRSSARSARHATSSHAAGTTGGCDHAPWRPREGLGPARRAPRTAGVGSGCSRKATSVITPSVPSEPQSSLARS